MKIEWKLRSLIEMEEKWDILSFGRAVTLIEEHNCLQIDRNSHFSHFELSEKQGKSSKEKDFPLTMYNWIEQ